MPRKRNKAVKGKAVPRKALFILFTALALITAAFCALKIFFAQSRYFNIASVKIAGINENRFSSLKQRLMGKNILAYDLSSLQEAVETLYPEVQCLKIKRRMPNELIIFLRDRKAVAQLNLGRFYIIDQTGVIMEKISDSAFESLPVISGLEAGSYKPKAADVFPGQKLQDILKLLREKNNNHNLLEYEITKINAENSGSGSFIIYSGFPEESLMLEPSARPYTEVKFNLEDSVQAVKILSLLLAKHKNELGRIKYIDLRNVNAPVILEKKEKDKKARSHKPR